MSSVLYGWEIKDHKATTRQECFATLALAQQAAEREIAATPSLKGAEPSFYAHNREFRRVRMPEQR